MTEMDMLREELKDFYLMTTGLTYNSNVSNELIEEYVKTAKTKVKLITCFHDSWIYEIFFVLFSTYKVKAERK